MNKWLEERHIEAAPDEILVPFEETVLVFDARHVIVARGRQRRKELRPIDVAEARQTRHLPAHPLRQDAIVIQAFAVDVQILGSDQTKNLLVVHAASQFLQ